MNRIVITALSALALMSCATTEAKSPPAAVARPALWKVADADTTVYLFGTIHALPQGLNWVSPKLAAALDSSQTLVTEVVFPKDMTSMGATMAGMAVTPNLPPVLDRVAPAKRAALKTVIDKAGLPLAALDRFETWFVALQVTNALLKDAGLGVAEGADKQLTSRFEKAGKPIAGLETAEQQFGFFDTLPERAQRQLLESLADDQGSTVALDQMIAAWRNGDVRGIGRTFNAELDDSPELTDALLTRRNANWATWVATRMAQPGTVFIAVGAGHLAGRGSVEAQLQRRGLKVTRVQ